MIEKFSPKREGERAEETVYLTKLEEEKSSLNEELQKLREEKTGEIDSADDVSNAQQDRVRREEIIHNSEERLKEVKKAIAWAKEYGFVCSICGKKIEKDRLQADPASVTCKEHLNSEDECLGLVA